jgi:predicted phosphoribosyltransferase
MKGGIKTLMFQNRTDAGLKLAEKLAEYRDGDAVVFALPRGGVVLGAEIANKLNAPLDLVIVRKIGHPSNPEYAIGAIAENGDPVFDRAETMRVNPQWLWAEIGKEREEIRRRRRRYLGERTPCPVEGRTAIIVDDGGATGHTMMAAINEIRHRKPRKVVVAVPIAPYDTAQILMRLADELVTVKTDPNFIGGVGGYYADFPQVEDAEVISLLKSNIHFERTFG